MKGPKRAGEGKRSREGESTTPGHFLSACLVLSCVFLVMLCVFSSEGICADQSREEHHQRNREKGNHSREGAGP